MGNGDEDETRVNRVPSLLTSLFLLPRFVRYPTSARKRPETYRLAGMSVRDLVRLTDIYGKKCPVRNPGYYTAPLRYIYVLICRLG